MFALEDPLIQGREKGSSLRSHAVSDGRGGWSASSSMKSPKRPSTLATPRMRLSPSLPDLTSLFSTSNTASAQPLTSPCATSSPSPTSPVDLPPLSPSTATPSQDSSAFSPKTRYPPALDAVSAACREKAGGSKTSVSHGSSINRGQPRKIASLDTGPPLLRRTDRARRYSLGGSGDYPRSVSVSAAVELSRAESFTALHRPAVPSYLSDAAAAASVEREQQTVPARMGREGKGREREGIVRRESESEGYESDEEFVKLYGLVAQHRAAERALVSNAFAKVLSRPGQVSYSPKGETSSAYSTIMGSGSGCSPKDGTGSGCSSIARSRSGCFLKAGRGCDSIVRSGSIRTAKDGTRNSGSSSIIRSSSNCFPKVGTGKGCNPKFMSHSGSNSSFRWAGGDIISTSNDKTCGVAAADEHEGRFNMPGCADMLPNDGIISGEPLLPSPRAAVSGPLAAVKGHSGNAPCVVLKNRSRKSLDSAVVNVAFTGVSEMESIRTVMDLGKIHINQRRNGHQQRTQAERGFLWDQSGAEGEGSVVATRATISLNSKKGLAGSSTCNSLVFPRRQQEPFPLHTSGSRLGFSRSASESVPHASTLDNSTVPSAAASPRSMLQAAWQADGKAGKWKSASPQATSTGDCIANSKPVTHLKPGHRRRVSLSAITVELSSFYES